MGLHILVGSFDQSKIILLNKTAPFSDSWVRVRVLLLKHSILFVDVKGLIRLVPQT